MSTIKPTNILNLADDLLETIKNNIIINKQNEQYKKDFNSVLWDMKVLFSFKDDHDNKLSHYISEAYKHHGNDTENYDDYWIKDHIDEWMINRLMIRTGHMNKSKLHEELVVKAWTPTEENINDLLEELGLD